MPHQIKCPRCAKTGLVRVEHVIKASSATQLFYCGACEYTWSIAERSEPLTPTPPPPKRPA